MGGQSTVYVPPPLGFDALPPLSTCLASLFAILSARNRHREATAPIENQTCCDADMASSLVQILQECEDRVQSGLCLSCLEQLCRQSPMCHRVGWCMVLNLREILSSGEDTLLSMGGTLASKKKRTLWEACQRADSKNFSSLIACWDLGLNHVSPISCSLALHEKEILFFGNSWERHPSVGRLLGVTSMSSSVLGGSTGASSPVQKLVLVQLLMCLQLLSPPHSLQMTGECISCVQGHVTTDGDHQQSGVIPVCRENPLFSAMDTDSSLSVLFLLWTHCLHSCSCSQETPCSIMGVQVGIEFLACIAEILRLLRQVLESQYAGGNGACLWAMSGASQPGRQRHVVHLLTTLLHRTAHVLQAQTSTLISLGTDPNSCVTEDPSVSELGVKLWMEQSLELVAATLFLVCQINEGLRALTQSGFIESSRTARQDENRELLIWITTADDELHRAKDFVLGECRVHHVNSVKTCLEDGDPPSREYSSTLLCRQCPLPSRRQLLTTGPPMGDTQLTPFFCLRTCSKFANGTEPISLDVRRTPFSQQLQSLPLGTELPAVALEMLEETDSSARRRTATEIHSRHRLREMVAAAEPPSLEPMASTPPGASTPAAAPRQRITPVVVSRHPDPSEPSLAEKSRSVGRVHPYLQVPAQSRAQIPRKRPAPEEAAGDIPKKRSIIAEDPGK